MNRRQFVFATTAAALSCGMRGYAKVSERKSVTAVDTHAHIFERGLKLTAERRYAPDYDATVDDYLRLLDANHISQRRTGAAQFPGYGQQLSGRRIEAAPEPPEGHRGSRFAGHY